MGVDLESFEHGNHTGAGINVPLVFTHRVVGEDAVFAFEGAGREVKDVGMMCFAYLVFITEIHQQVFYGGYLCVGVFVGVCVGVGVIVGVCVEV